MTSIRKRLMRMMPTTKHRLREAEKALARDIKGRDGKPGPLGHLAKLTGNGTPYNPYRIFPPDSLRP